MILDKVDPEIRRSFNQRGWLPLLDVDHLPPAILIRKFYSNLFVHSTSSNIQFLKGFLIFQAKKPITLENRGRGGEGFLMGSRLPNHDAIRVGKERPKQKPKKEDKEN